MAGETFTFGLNGGGNFQNPNVWSPSLGAPPRSGQDQNLSIVGQTLTVQGQPWADFDVRVINPASISFVGGQTLGDTSTLKQTAAEANYFVSNGNLLNFGNVDIGGTGQQATARVFVNPGAAFVNNDTIDVDGNLFVSGGGQFINNGTLTIENGVAQIQQAAGGDAAGSYVIGKGGTLAFNGFFNTATVSFAPDANGVLTVGTPFSQPTLRAIKGFDAGDTITIPGLSAASNWQQRDASEGVLTIGGQGGTPLASIAFQGAYDPNAFTVTPDPGRNISVITTTKATPPKVVVEEPSKKVDTNTVQTDRPVLDLDFHGFRDIKGRAVNGDDVTLTLTKLTIQASGLQRADFLDGSLVFDGTSPNGRWDPDENAASIARMYYTVLGRGPEFAGAHYWVEDVMEARNLSIRDLAVGFYESREFQSRYGTNTTNQEFVSLLYRNVLGREGEAGGVQFWTGNLDRGVSRSEVVVSISESYEHQAIRFQDIEANGVRFLGDPFL